MYCRKCGKELRDKAAFCGSCGNPVNETRGVPTSEPRRVKQTDYGLEKRLGFWNVHKVKKPELYGGYSNWTYWLLGLLGALLAWPVGLIVYLMNFKSKSAVRKCQAQNLLLVAGIGFILMLGVIVEQRNGGKKVDNTGLFAAAGTKYDIIIADSGFQDFLAVFKKEVTPTKYYMDYLRLLVDHDDVVAMVKSGELDKEKSKFVMSNSESFLTYLHALIFAYQLGKQNPPIKDAEIVYITGVIKSPKAQAARTSSEYEVEKMVLRGMFTYSLWEKWREPGFLKKMTDEQIDIMYKNLRTRK